jgi:hypothetical protein
MPSSNAKQSNGRALGLAPPLLPVSKGMDADANGPSESRLRKTDELSKRDDIVAGFEPTKHEPLANSSWNGPCKLL